MLLHATNDATELVGLLSHNVAQPYREDERSTAPWTRTAPR